MVKDLKYFREKAGIKQIDLAIKSGLKHSGTVSGTENYRFHLTEAVAKQLAPHLGVKAQELFLQHNYAAMKHKLARCGTDVKAISRVLLQVAEDEEAPQRLRRIALKGLRAMVKTAESEKGMAGRDLAGRRMGEKKNLSRNIITGCRR